MPDISQFTQDGFDPEGYVDGVIEAMGFKDLDESVKNQFRAEIGERLEREIMHSAIRNLDEDHYQSFKNLIKESPNTNPLGILMAVCEDQRDLAEKLRTDLESLFQELVREADQVRKTVEKYKR